MAQSSDYFDFTDKVLLVTGGSPGIGRTTAVLFLCSELATFTAGHAFVLDGGYTAH